MSMIEQVFTDSEVCRQVHPCGKRNCILLSANAQRERETDRQTDRQTETETETQRDRDRQRERVFYHTRIKI